MPKQQHYRLPVVSLSAEYLVMGHLLRRNILTYKAAPMNEGYDLICIHPDPRRQKSDAVRVQVKSRYATDGNAGFLVREQTLAGFDFLIVAFLNIGNFYRGRSGAEGAAQPDYYTLPVDFVRKHHNSKSSMGKVALRSLKKEIEPFHNDRGFEQIAKRLGVERPQRPV